MVRATLKHGINISSGDALISYGIILCGAFREPKRGREMAKAGELILEKYEFKKSRATLGADGLIYYWTAPLLDTELDIESYFLAVKKLRGVEIQEDERDFDGILAVASEIGNQSLLGNIYLIQLDLKVFSGEWEEAAKMLESAGNVQDALFAKFSGVRWTILEALISIRATRFSKKMLISLKWRRRAYKSVKRVRGWAKKKNPNIEHSLHLLEAELASSKGKKRKAILHYRDAIDTAEGMVFCKTRHCQMSWLVCTLTASATRDKSRFTWRMPFDAIVFRVGSYGQGRAVANSDGSCQLESASQYNEEAVLSYHNISTIVVVLGVFFP